MKQITLIFTILWSVAAFASANRDSIPHLGVAPEFEDCDACGCSSNGGGMGFSSMFNNNFVGVRYFNQNYRSRDGIFSNSPWVREHFNTAQVWARIPIVRRLQASVILPYHFHSRGRISGSEHISGLGDATLLAMWTAYETTRDSTVFTHKFQLGGGLKAPTGKFDAANNKGSVNPGFQLGTGSWDYLIAAEYVLKKGALGMSTMLTYIFKTENEKLYRFGDQFNYGATTFYLIERQFKWVPQIGVAGEVFGSNFQLAQRIAHSEGTILFGKAGLEVGRNGFSLGVNAMLPIAQNLSDGKVENNYRWSVNFNYSL